MPSPGGTNEARRFRLLEPVGRGGFGVVYKAELLDPDGFSKLVALKVLHRDVPRAQEKARRLRDEARILGLVRHRAVVHAEGLVRLNGRWTVVMEYVEGVTIKRLLELGRFPQRVAVAIVAEVAAALDVAYKSAGPDGRPLRLLHRDIKPSNVQVTAAGEVKILDFGLARADFDAREADTVSLQFGSWPYMSPERMDGVDGTAGDVYGLGAVLYEVLTGERFGKAFGHPERHEARLVTALETLIQVVDGIDDDLVAFVGSMLAHDPEMRPATREVERGLRELDFTSGPSLRDWAEESVARCPSRPVAHEADMLGDITVDPTEELGHGLPASFGDDDLLDVTVESPAERTMPITVVATASFALGVFVTAVVMVAWGAVVSGG
jgi:serine/threonine protein kinase